MTWSMNDFLQWIPYQAIYMNTERYILNNVKTSWEPVLWNKKKAEAVVKFREQAHRIWTRDREKL